MYAHSGACYINMMYTVHTISHLHASFILIHTGFTVQPRDVPTLVNSTVTFRCSYTGSLLPHWDAFIRDESNRLPSTATESIVRGRIEPLIGGGYLNFTSSAGQMAVLEVLATRESNGSEFQCVFISDPNIESRRGTLTVFGECSDYKIATAARPYLCECVGLAVRLQTCMH